jgi:hypothetical protein
MSVAYVQGDFEQSSTSFLLRYDAPISGRKYSRTSGSRTAVTIVQEDRDQT